MKSLKLNKKSITNLSLLLIIILPYFLFSQTPTYSVSSKNNDIEVKLLDINKANTNSYKPQLSDWDEMISIYDENKNGLTDIFENKLKSFQNNRIPLIIQFPENTDYSLASSIFENEGGNIKFKYEHAINGFAGTIDHFRLNIFTNKLKENEIEFLMEEDHKSETHLYYTSRNMNLRPYVWNTLTPGYDGDNTSSIAILDTGIDESHEFFDNYTFGDFDYKIVGWRDFTSGGDNFTVADYDGHGSHTAGIAAGMGTPLKDGLGRSIATHAENLDYTASDPADESYDVVYFSRFNVPSLGEIEIEAQFNQTTADGDYVLADFYLIRNNIAVAEYLTFAPGDWINNFTYNVDSSTKLGDYYVAAILTFYDNSGDNICRDPNVTVRAETHFPFAPSSYGSGNLWKGVAPDTHLVSVKVIPGGSGEIIRAIDWVISNRTVLNITVMSMSIGLVDGFGDPISDAGVISAVNNAVENGIVTVVSAGNDGAGGNNMGSPADADNVITVAANTFDDQIAYYSSQGGSVGNTIKPDITAPGGSGAVDGIQMFSADTNDNDAEGAYSTDALNNDLYGAQGTSMSCPAVSGAANLLIEAMGGAIKWNWTDGSTSKLVKALLLMTATETYPLQREYLPNYSPSLNRGGKDVHEGYGRINVDAAIEAWIFNWTTNITNSELLTADLSSSYTNSSTKHAKAGYVELTKDISYIFNLSVPTGVDYDMHLYNSTPDVYGEPDLIWSSKSSIKGNDEIVNYTANYTGKYFLVIKAVGLPLPPAALVGDDDDDDDDDIKIWDLIEFLSSPLGLLLVVGLVAAVVILIVLIARREKEEYIYRPDY